MWTMKTQILEGGATAIHVLDSQQHLLTFEHVLGLFQTALFAAWFTKHLLAFVSHEAIYFECRPASPADLATLPFEAVSLPAPTLEGLRSESQAFGEHWHKAVSGVATFANMRNDATLISPAPASQASSFTHLAAFLRTGPAEVVREFWRQAAVAFLERPTVRPAEAQGEHARPRPHPDRHRPIWLSTAGNGVSWLHMRVDDQPKYYNWEPFTLYRRA